MEVADFNQKEKGQQLVHPLGRCKRIPYPGLHKPHNPRDTDEESRLARGQERPGQDLKPRCLALEGGFLAPLPTHSATWSANFRAHLSPRGRRQSLSEALSQNILSVE